MRYALPALLAMAGLLCLWGQPSGAADGTGAEKPASLPEPTDQALRDRERQALMTFYEALGGPDWIQRDFWGSDRPVGEWHGIETDAEGRVVRLTIYDNNLDGRLSPAVCGLARLHTLHLSLNNLSGPLPDELGKCRALKNLWLKGNRLTGQIPQSVTELPELEYLDVHANRLSGSLPIVWDTPKLTIFRAEDNKIAGALPAALFRQPSLEQVFLHNNKLTRSLPPSLANAAQLHSLLLADNALTGPIPDSLRDATSLQVLRLNHNRLSGPIPQGLATRLTVFDVSHNPGLEPGE